MSPEVFLAGVGGALLVFGLGVLKEWWQRRRERNGLLLILFSEVAANHRSVSFLLTMLHAGKANIVMELEMQHVSDEAWKESRTRLAQHLPGNDLAALTEYYRNLPVLEDTIHRSPTEDTLKTLRFALNNQDELGLEAQRIIRKYVPVAKARIMSEEDMDRLEKGRSLRELMEEDQ